MRVKLETLEQLMSRTKQEGECLEFTGHILPKGYGQVRFQGRMQNAHRVSWQLSEGPIPEGMLICHKCDNRACINPKHLFVGTAKENTQDMINKNRQSFHMPAPGVLHPRSKLTESQVLQIYRMAHEKGPFAPSQRKIANQFDISHQTVSRIKIGQDWAHLTGGLS